MGSSIGPKYHSPRKNANSLHLPDLCLGEPDSIADSSPYTEQPSRHGGRAGAMFLSEPLCDVAGVYMSPPLQLRASGRPRGKSHLWRVSVYPATLYSQDKDPSET